MAVRGTLLFTVVMAGLLWPSVPRAFAGDKYIVMLDIEGEREPRLKKSITRMIKSGQHKVMEGSNYRDAARRLRAVKLLPNNVKRVCGYLEADGVVDGTLVKESEQYKFVLRVRSCESGAIIKKIPMVLNQPRLSDPGMIDGLEQRLLTAIDNLGSHKAAPAPKKSGGKMKPAVDDDDDEADDEDEDEDDEADDEDDEDEDDSPKARKVAKAKADKLKADKAAKAKAEKMAKEKAAKDKADKLKADKLAKDKAAREKAERDKAAKAAAAKSRRASDDDEEEDDDDEADDEDDDEDSAAAGDEDDDEDDEEDEDAPKKAKKAAMKDGGDEQEEDDEDIGGDDEDEDDDLPSVEADDGGEARPRSGVTSARHTPVLLYAGASFIGRTLSFKHAGEAEDAPQGYKGSPVPGFLLTGAVYPMAFGGKRGATANIGIGFVAERAIGLKSAIDDGAGGMQQLATRQSRYGANLRYRYNFGDGPEGLSLEASVGFNKLAFVIDKGAAPMNVTVDVPNVSYTYIDPGLGARIPIFGKLSGLLEAKFLAVLDTGEIQKPAQYGAATVTGFDIDGGLEYRIGQHFLARGGVRYLMMGYKFKTGTGTLTDRNNDGADDVGGASDRYLGGYVTAGYIF
jgi:hypothetical protein